MIRTDGRRTIANAPPRTEEIPGQMTVEELIKLEEAKSKQPTLQQVMDAWEQEQREAEPIYGGF